MKYELTDEVLIHEGCTLYRIKALRDIPKTSIMKDTLGGWVTSEYNLSQEGTCWIGKHVKVFDKARVLENANVLGTSNLYDSATIKGHSRVAYSDIFGKAIITDKSSVIARSHIFGKAIIKGCSSVYASLISGKTTLNDCTISNSTLSGTNELYKANIVSSSIKNALDKVNITITKGVVSKPTDILLIDGITLFGSPITAYTTTTDISIHSDHFVGCIGDYSALEKLSGINIDIYKSTIAFIDVYMKHYAKKRKSS